MEEPLTPGEQFALRSEISELTQTDRISRPDALYGTSIPSQTFEAEEQAILTPTDCDEVDVIIA